MTQNSPPDRDGRGTPRMRRRVVRASPASALTFSRGLAPLILTALLATGAAS